MAGSLDDRRTVVIGKEDYDFVVRFKGHSEVFVSPISQITPQEIAAELRRVADIVEGR